MSIIFIISLSPLISYLFNDTISIEGYYIFSLLLGIITFAPFWEAYILKKDLEKGYVEEINGIVKGMDRGIYLFRMVERIYIDDGFTDLYMRIRYDYRSGKKVEMVIRPVTRCPFKITVNGKAILDDYS